MSKLLIPDRPGNLNFAIDLLNNAKPVALPTETVYGLASRMDLLEGVASVFRIKNRPHFDPLIVHVLNSEFLEKIAVDVNEVHRKLMRSFWPGPLTLLFKKSALVDDLITAGTDYVAVRSPSHPVFRKVLQGLNFPYLVAPSANRFTSVSPTNARDVIEELGSFGLEAVLDGGISEIGVESTVVKILNRYHIEVLRPGAISVEALKKSLGSEVEVAVGSSGTGAKASPGTHQLHYSPGIPSKYFENENEALSGVKEIDIESSWLIEVVEGSLPELRKLHWKKVLVLGQNPTEAAKNVFQTLRQIGKEKPASYVAVGADPSGLGLAINDRLRRAAGRG